MHDDEPLNPRFKKALLARMPEKSPVWQLLGIEFVDVGKGWAKMRIPFSDKLANALGTAHGGVLFTLADAAVSMALVTMMDKREIVTTVEMKINYLKPLAAGEAVAEARIIHCGETTALGDFEVKDADGSLIAKGMGTFLRKKPDR
jgi:uncharacterized protein (TIGR00369 family)